jgi:hypothetical protein
MKEDNYSVRDINGRPIDTGTPFIIGILRNIVLLITFPIRAFFYFLNPFPTKDGTPRQIKIRK